MEYWKDVPDYEGFYQASNYGRIKSLARIIQDKNGFKKRISERVLKQSISKDGYCLVSLHKAGNSTVYKVYQLVAKIFIDNTENKETVNHIDENKLNNHIKNLEWATRKEQANHGTRTQRSSNNRLNHPNQSKAIRATHKITQEVVIFPSMMEAQRNGFCISNICLCCQGKQKYHKNYKWEYVK